MGCGGRMLGVGSATSFLRSKDPEEVSYTSLSPGCIKTHLKSLWKGLGRWLSG